MHEQSLIRRRNSGPLYVPSLLTGALTEQVDDDNGIVCVALRLFVVVARLIEQERGHVGREDGRVDDEDEDDPVPERLERRVVQHGPLVDAGGLQLVLGHHLGAQ